MWLFKTMLKMRGILPKHNRAVSELVSYVMLVIIAITVSVLVYGFLKLYIPKDQPSCPEDISLIITGASCTTSPKQISINYSNKGLFSIDGAFVRLGQSGRTTKPLIFDLDDPAQFFIPSLAPGTPPLPREYSIPSSIAISQAEYTLEIEPLTIDKETNKIAACSNAIVTQKVTCT